MAWFGRYSLRGRRCEVRLGRFPQLSLADARKRHSELLAGVREGRSPAEQRRIEKQVQERGTTVKAFAERYLREHVARVRKNPSLIRRYFERDVYPVIGNKPLASVEKQELRSIIFAKIGQGHEQAALAIRNLLKRLWDYAIDCELTDKNLPKLIKSQFIAPLSSRTRALNEAELGAFLRGLDKARLRPELKIAFRLILLTLTRKSELRLARWEEFDLDRAEWALPQAHSKMETPLVIPLSRQAVELLKQIRPADPRCGCVFPMIGATHTPMAPSTLNRALKRIPVKIEHFTIHDLRRSAATILAEKEFNADWIEKSLNHKLQGVRGVYNRAQYAPQRQSMLQAWADCLDELQRRTD
jgi:integrase